MGQCSSSAVCCSGRSNNGEISGRSNTGDFKNGFDDNLRSRLTLEKSLRSRSGNGAPLSPAWTKPVHAKDFMTKTIELCWVLLTLLRAIIFNNFLATRLGVRQTQNKHYFINTDGIFVGSAVDDYADSNGTLSTGSRVRVVEEVTMKAKNRVRGRIEEPEGWISLRNTQTGYCIASPIEEGHSAYVVMTNEIHVGATSNDFTPIWTLSAGTRVVVLEHVELEEKKRVRGRILDPEGWISIRNTETGRAFVRSIEGRELELQFKAGPMGAAWEKSGQIIAVSPDGQANELGVKVGWVIVRVCGTLYEEELLKRKIGSATSYMLTFANVEKQA